MASPLGILLLTLIFPVIVYLFVFDRVPIFTRLFDQPIDIDAISHTARKRRRPDLFGDDERPDFNPTARQQLETRTLLLRFLPPELVLPILSLASYHSLLTSVQTRKAIVKQASVPYLVSPRFPRAGRVEEIRIALKSKDQGYSSYPGDYGTYRTSSSFFQAFLLRPTAAGPAPTNHRKSSSWGFLWSTSMEDDSTTLDPVEIEVPHSRRIIQYNVHAGQFLKPHLLEPISRQHPTPHTPPLIKLSQPGDRIVIEATARYPAWENRVAAARIDMYVAYYHGPGPPVQEGQTGRG